MLLERGCCSSRLTNFGTSRHRRGSRSAGGLGSCGWNAGGGWYRRAAVLPLPAYFGGFTSVPSLTSADLDADGALDLILVHQRNDGSDLPGESFTGRYVQVLINQGGFRFEDQSAFWFGDQSATAAPEQDSMGRPTYVDANGDGCQDIAISGSGAIGKAAPPLYLRSATFEATLVRELPSGAFALDLDGDGRVDFAAVEGSGLVALRQHD